MTQTPIQTPYYLIDKSRLLANLRCMQQLRHESGARLVLALKCFATWSVFDLMREFMDGSTSSSLYEVRLGRERFGGETHAYSVAWAEHEFDEVVQHADKVIFNSLSQFERLGPRVRGKPVGLRLNPGVSASGFALADPVQPFSRLGESDPERVAEVVDRLDGFMIHNNCENRDFERFDAMLAQLEERLAPLFARVRWVSLGGGIQFTAPGYPLQRLAARLRAFATRHDVQVYLEPGEAAVTDAATLEVSVLDVLDKGKPVVVVDASTEAHMLDLLIYRESAQLQAQTGPHRVLVCGRSCLAGDVFGEFALAALPRVGQRLSLRHAAAYTMVKKNWFNGLTMPSIAVRELDGSQRLVREFSYQDFESSLS